MKKSEGDGDKREGRSVCTRFANMGALVQHLTMLSKCYSLVIG